METNYQVIDMNSWKRRLHSQIFRESLQPQFNVCLELDITHFQQIVKDNGWSFTLAFIHTVTTCANSFEEFRYRFLDGAVALYDLIHTSFTYLDAETELFKVINVPMIDDIEEYMKLAKQTIEQQEQYITGPIANDVYQFSSLPWISFTHFSHTLSGKSEKSNPMFDWGKYTFKNERLMLPFAVQVHHSFIDGFHVGRFVEALQEELNRFKI